MTLNGHIEGGHVVFDSPLNLPDGTEVTLIISPKAPSGTTEKAPTLYERMRPIIGIAEHLPPNASTTIDEVLYGRADE